MSYNSQIETREIADAALDAIAGGANGGALSLHGTTDHLCGVGGVELAGHGLVTEGMADLKNGVANLNVATF